MLLIVRILSVWKSLKLDSSSFFFMGWGKKLGKGIVALFCYGLGLSLLLAAVPYFVSGLFIHALLLLAAVLVVLPFTYSVFIERIVKVKAWKRAILGLVIFFLVFIYTPHPSENSLPSVLVATTQVVTKDNSPESFAECDSISGKSLRYKCFDEVISKGVYYYSNCFDPTLTNSLQGFITDFQCLGGKIPDCNYFRNQPGCLIAYAVLTKNESACNAALKNYPSTYYDECIQYFNATR